MLHTSPLFWFFENRKVEHSNIDIAKELLDGFQCGEFDEESIDLRMFANEHWDEIKSYMLDNIDCYLENLWNHEELYITEPTYDYVHKLVGDYEGGLRDFIKLTESE